MEPLEFNATPQQIAWGMLIALGILVIVMDILRAADQLRMHDQAQVYLNDPNKLAEEALHHLGQDPAVVDEHNEREESDNGS